MKTIFILLLLSVLSTNGGIAQTGWFPLTDTSSIKWQGIHFFDEENGIAVGNKFTVNSTATMISTQNGGLDWETIPLPDSLFFSQRMLFTSRDTGFIVGDTHNGDKKYNTAIYRTVDGGKTWMKPIQPIIRGMIRSISSSGNGVIYAGGYYVVEEFKNGGTIINYLILKTTDYGESWNAINAQFYDFNATDTFSPKKDDIYSISFRDSLNGLAITLYDGYSLYFQTTDGGYNWYRKYESLRQSGVGLHYLGENIWLMGAKFRIYRSTDNAVSWSEVGFRGTNAESFSFFNGSFGMSVPGYRMFQGNEQIQRTYDSGKTWEIADYGIPLHHEMGAISVVSSTVAYCAGVICRDGYFEGCKGIIYKTIDGGGPANNPTGVVEFIEGGRNFTVYPNPTTSTLQLTYKVSNQEQRLVVSDLLGKIVLSTTLSPETTETTLNLSELPAGTYFCRLRGEVRVVVVVR